MQDHLSDLNKKQREAATHIEGPLLVIAGAGAGKTKTITHRILNLIENGISPENILAVTFTNKAAKEMRDRVVNLIENLSEFGNAFSQVLGSPRQNISLQESKLGQTIRKSTTEPTDNTPFISTFHSLGVYIIKENARLLGLNKYFSILDESDSTQLIKESLKELGLDPKQYDPKKIKNIISREKGKFVELVEYKEKEQFGIGQIVGEVWEIYEKKKKKENSLDFDDLLVLSVKLLKENKEIRENYQNKWKYIHIDEYQDTNEVQYLITKILSEKHKNICVVGDADQNIYSWRGANLKNILNFEKDYQNTKIVLLEENYRSTKNILEAANEVIKKNKWRPEKNLFTNNKIGEKISLYEALEENDEADFVATKILEITDKNNSSDFSSLRPSPSTGWDPREAQNRKNYFNKVNARQNVLERTLGSSDGDGQRKFSVENFRGESENILPEIAILYRANFQSRALEETMLRYGIPYQVLGIKFFERKEIKDTLAYIRAALNPESLSDIKRIINFPARGIGKATLAKIFANEKESLPIKTKIKIDNFYKILEDIKEKIKTEKTSEVIKFTLRKTGIEGELSSGGEEDLERLENIKELVTLALKYDELKDGDGIEKLIEDAALASDQDSLILNGINPVRGREGSQRPSTSNGVKLMTVHASKGLEFDYVFVVGLEDGLFPHERKDSGSYSQKGGEAEEEERRLFYVAITRAKEKLFLSFANFRTIFGARQINTPSEFISDIPSDIIEKEGEQGAIKTIYI